MNPRPELHPDCRAGSSWRVTNAWHRALRGLALLALLPVFPLNSPAQSVTSAMAIAPSAEFAIETWRTDNGIPQNSVTAVLQTQRGYIWAGTYNGLAQFDGVRFTVFDSSNTEGLANSRITSLFENSRGEIWIGHDTGEVSRYTDGKFFQVRLPASWGRNPIKDFAEDEHGDLWVLQQLGDALRLRDGWVASPPAMMAENPFANPRVVMDTRHRAYVVRNGVVARLTAAGYEPLDFGDASEQPYYLGIAAARDGQLWVAGEGRLRKWNGTNWSADLGELPRTDISVTTMLEATTGRLLLGTLQYGLLVHDPITGWFILSRTNGLPQDWVNSVAEDREKNLWVATGGGLAVLRERRVTMVSPPDDWQGRPVQSIVRTRAGSVWAATEGAGLYHFTGGAWTRFGPAEGLANPFVWSVFEDSAQAIWAGTWGGGLFRLEHGRFVSQTNLIPTADPVVALAESPAGTMWVGTGAGLWRVRGNNVEHLANRGGAAARDVRTIEPGPDGAIWIGSQGAGLGRWQEGEFTTFLATNGLAGNYIISLFCETNGTLWIGTLDMGVSRYRDGEFRTLNTTHGLPSNIIFHIEEDDLGNLWFNSATGLFRVTKRELNDCADGRRSTVRALVFGKEAGLATLVGTGGFTPAGFRAPDGRLWFSTARGIAVLTPQSTRPNLVPPPVWIEEVFVDEQPVPNQRPARPRTGRGIGTATPRGLVVLPPGSRQLEVQFSGLSFTSPERVQFKYRLEPLDPDWRPASTRRRETFSFLPPGNYTFHVIACNSDGLWSETADTLAIVMLPHFWQTWWFKALMVINGSIVLALIFFLESRRRLQRKLERIARERELERERARIAQDIHDDLGASLTRIGMLSQSAAGDLHDPPRVTADLIQIYDTARDLTRAMDEIVWAVNPHHDTLDSLTNYLARFAHDFLRAASIRCRLETPMQVPDLTVRSEIRHNLFLAFKETLNNAVKHSGASEVRVSVELLPGRLKVTVADNGAGLKPRPAAAAPAGDRLISGYGMSGIRTRLEQVGGRMELSSEPGAGTRVELFVPMPLIERAKDGW